uniref:Ground-like domain-containing protein n=1 Tax=Panagrolaimus sp. PS1159 TaxID=55785 RepID=A0AC35GB73_9BILA
MAEMKFNQTFETLVGISNFASKTRFHGNFLCKVKAEGKIILSYGTPKKSNPLESIPLPVPFRRRHYTFTYRV